METEKKTEQRTRKASPAKNTIDKLRAEGYIHPLNKLRIVNVNDEDVVDIELTRFIGIRPALIDAASSDFDKAKSILTKLKHSGMLDSLLAEINA